MVISFTNNLIDELTDYAKNNIKIINLQKI